MPLQDTKKLTHLKQFCFLSFYLIELLFKERKILNKKPKKMFQTLLMKDGGDGI